MDGCTLTGGRHHGSGWGAIGANEAAVSGRPAQPAARPIRASILRLGPREGAPGAMRGGPGLVGEVWAVIEHVGRAGLGLAGLKTGGGSA